MELLSWLDGRGVKWTVRAFRDAAEGGSEEVLEWLVAHGCPMPVGVMADEVGVVVASFSRLTSWGRGCGTLNSLSLGGVRHMRGVRKGRCHREPHWRAAQWGQGVKRSGLGGAEF